MFNEVDGMVVMKEEELIAGECKREEDNCIPQLRANMLAVAGGWGPGSSCYYPEFNKIMIHGIGAKWLLMYAVSHK